MVWLADGKALGALGLTAAVGEVPGDAKVRKVRGMEKVAAERTLAVESSGR